MSFMKRNYPPGKRATLEKLLFTRSDFAVLLDLPGNAGDKL